uniref:F-box/FBD/LRR-repeat protein At1g13570-like n=2 Tax=Nicotiana sylvestris TaxID=4096 RepID=A0A1U7X474_NICSY|nr:PREDICTED: F-box/FBD/LRR-repeat protein At1g13570-like [Nicotiana sylvestris]
MMPPNSKKQSLPPNVLGNLPENVIDDILLRLPLRDAVRTCILSKNWRYKWCKLPQLKLDQTLWETTNDLIPPTVKITDIIYQLLTLHVGHISKFILSIFDLINCPKIDNLIYFLSRNGIQHLVLQFPIGNPYKLPSSFFTCLQLRHVTLHRCILRTPPVFKGFHRLLSLELSQVTICTEFLGRFISRCPLLEHLLLEYVDNANNIEVNAPKLRSFVFTGNLHFLHLKCVPLLAKVSHESTASLLKAGKNDFVNFFNSIPALEHLHWNYNSFRFMVTGPGEVPTRLPSALNCLKHLYLSEICLEERVELLCALCLIRSSPNLEELEIKGPFDLIGKLLAPVLWSAVDEIPASFSDVTYTHLRAVKIKGVAGAWGEMQLIKVLLAKSPVLVRMVIEPDVVGDQSLKVLAKITKFQRASPKAEVVYNVDAYPGYNLA